MSPEGCGEVWLEKGLEKAGRLAEESLPEEAQKVVRLGLEHMKLAKGSLSVLGASGLTSALAQFYVGQDEQAYLLFLAAGATFQERRAASHASTGATFTARQLREQAWEEFQEMAENLGRDAIRHLLPLLLVVL